MGLFDKIHKKLEIPAKSDALPGRVEPIDTASHHFVNKNRLAPPYPEGVAVIHIGMGCFWGAERLFWSLKGVYVTCVGYMAGHTPNPTYEEVCSGGTGHNEVVLIAFDPEILSLNELLNVFWENHDPTQGMRQGNDRGTQYRSGIYFTNDQQSKIAITTRERYQQALTSRNVGTITTEIVQAGPFYFAEEYHQQYLEKNPSGYCGIRGTGVACPVPA